jgi:hypothetical protein
VSSLRGPHRARHTRSRSPLLYVNA